MDDGAGDGDRSDGEEIAEVEVEADAEHEEDDADVGELLDGSWIGAVAGGDGGDEEAGEEVADDGGEANCPREKAPGGGEAEGYRDGGDEREVMHWGGLAYQPAQWGGQRWAGLAGGYDDDLAILGVGEGGERGGEVIEPDDAGDHGGGIDGALAEGFERFGVFGWGVAEDELEGELLVDGDEGQDPVFLHADADNDDAPHAVDELDGLLEGAFDADAFEDDGGCWGSD